MTKELTFEILILEPIKIKRNTGFKLCNLKPLHHSMSNGTQAVKLLIGAVMLPQSNYPSIIDWSMALLVKAGSYYILLSEKTQVFAIEVFIQYHQYCLSLPSPMILFWRANTCWTNCLSPPAFHNWKSLSSFLLALIASLEISAYIRRFKQFYFRETDKWWVYP